MEKLIEKMSVRYLVFCLSFFVVLIGGCRCYRYTGQIVSKPNKKLHVGANGNNQYHLASIDVNFDYSQELFKKFAKLDEYSLKSLLVRRNKWLSGSVSSDDSVLLKIYAIKDYESDGVGSAINNLTMGILPFSRIKSAEFLIEASPVSKGEKEAASINVIMKQEKRFTPFCLWPFWGEGDGCVSYRYWGLGGSAHRRVVDLCYADLIDKGLKSLIYNCDGNLGKCVQCSLDSQGKQNNFLSPAFGDNQTNSCSVACHEKKAEDKNSTHKEDGQSKQEEKNGNNIVAKFSKVYKFFNIEFGRSIGKEMRNLGILPEETKNKDVKLYRLGLEFEDFLKDISGSRCFLGFRPSGIYSKGEEDKICGIIASRGRIIKGRGKMGLEVNKVCSEITSILGCEAKHKGSKEEHWWEWRYKDSMIGDVAVKLCAISDNDDYWSLFLSLLSQDAFELGKGIIESGFSGTGWFCSSNIVVTCAHVVKDAQNISILNQKGVEYKAKIVGIDEQSDIAILEVEGYKSQRCLPVSSKIVKISSNVFTIGYPFPSMLGKGQKYTEGVISATSGIDGDRTTYQISVPIQPGNSGGALLDESGCVIGVTSSGLNAIVTAQLTGTLPQNINYAVKSRYILNLLEDFGLKCAVESTYKDKESIVELLSEATVFIKVLK